MPKEAPKAFEGKLAKALRPYPVGGRYLVGVSGGRDSVSLLHGLMAAGYRRLIVCHLNHGLRGQEAVADANFVRQLADEMKLAVVIGETDVRSLASQRKLSLETAAREARYRFFGDVASRRRCRTLFLAHQADDQAETFLFNLLRGSGAAGLAAMATVCQRRLGKGVVTLVRPLLSVWREEIDAYLCSRGHAWRDDATNTDPTHASRNRLRAEVLPALEKAMGRPVKPALWRAAEILGAEDAWLDALCAKESPLPEKLSVETLRALPLAAQRRIVRAWLAAQQIPDVGYREVESVVAMLVQVSPAKVNLAANRHARRRSGSLFLE